MPQQSALPTFRSAPSVAEFNFKGGKVVGVGGGSTRRRRRRRRALQLTEINLIEMQRHLKDVVVAGICSVYTQYI